MEFCNILSQSPCTFTSGYLDDIILVDIVQKLGIEITRFQAAAADLGLVLNEKKCEIIVLTEQLRQSNY